MNKKIIAILASSVMASVFASAAEPAAATANTAAPTAPVAPAVADASILDGFSASTTFAYESAYVFRGEKIANGTFMPAADFGYDIGKGFATYAGIWNASPLNAPASGAEEIDLYGGVTYSWEALTFDLGYTYYWYTQTEAAYDRSNEIKFGVGLDTTEWLGVFNVSPSVAYYYDWNLEANTIEVALDYSAPVSQWILGKDGVSLDTSVYYGYTDKNRALGDNGAPKTYIGYGYVGFSSDVVYAINEYATISAGIRYAYNNDITVTTSKILWFGTALNIGF